MASLRTQLEDALTAAIRATLVPPAPGGYLRAVEPYNGEIHTGTPDEAYELLRGRAPSILLATGDSKSDTLNVQRTRALKAVDVDLYLVSTSLRSREDRTRGDVGIYQIAEDLERLLIGRDSGVAGVGILELASEKAIMHRPEMCVWQVQYTVPIQAYASDPDANAPSLLQIYGRAKLPAAAVVFATQVGDALVASGGNVTLSVAAAAFTSALIGADVIISGATSPANNGRFQVTAVPSPTTIRWANPAGVTETYAGASSLVPGTLVTIRETLAP